MTSQEYAIQWIPITQIRAGDNDRKVFKAQEIESLAASISQIGLRQPPTVRYNPNAQSDYEIVAGERRFRAVQLLAWETCPVIIADLDDETASNLMMAENTARQDLNPIEEAQAYGKRMSEFGYSIEQVADLAGVSTDVIKSRLSLLTLRGDIQHLIATGNFPLGHAEYMAGLDVNRQMIAVQAFTKSDHMPYWKFRQLVNDLREAQGQKALFDLESYWQELIEADKVTIQKRNRVGLPVRDDLPRIDVRPKDTASTVILRFMETLQAQGFSSEAEVVGTLLDLLIEKNFCRLPKS